MIDINDVVISSRIRLARNVEGLVFPARLNDERALRIAKSVYEALSRCDNFDLFKINNLKSVDANVLKEKHLISNDLIDSPYGAAVINESETVSIMVNEEDHIREQCILRGMNLKEAYKKINEIDDAIGKNVKFAFDPKLGYLTSCPTNLGTGMRASVMMFLPGLSLTNTLEQCVSAVGRLNMTIRGVYGEGSEAEGYIYQLSNQRTLGVTEEEIINSVETSINHIVEAEERARDVLMKMGETALKDNILRAYGILSSCYTVTSQEFMNFAGLIKLGAYYNILKIADTARFEKLLVDAQPANIISICGKSLNSAERDVYRASYVGKSVKSLVKR